MNFYAANALRKQHSRKTCGQSVSKLVLKPGKRGTFNLIQKKSGKDFIIANLQDVGSIESEFANSRKFRGSLRDKPDSNWTLPLLVEIGYGNSIASFGVYQYNPIPPCISEY